MSKLTDLLNSIFSSEKAIVTEDGQRTLSIDSILPEVEGLKLFGEDDEGEESLDEKPVEEIANIIEYASASELRDVIDRLLVLERLIVAVDDLKGSSGNVKKEIW